MKKVIAGVLGVSILLSGGLVPERAQAAEPIQPKADVGVCDYTMTGYQYHSTLNSSVKVQKLLAGGATIVLSYYLPQGKAVLGLQLANLYHVTMRDNVYTKQVIYKQYANTGKTLKPIASAKTTTTFYSDSARTKKIGAKTDYEYTSWYCKR